MTTCFEILMSKILSTSTTGRRFNLGPIFYVLYNIFMIFILLTMLISIFDDSFKMVNGIRYLKDEKLVLNYDNLLKRINLKEHS